jgi:hypothetical protein
MNTKCKFPSGSIEFIDLQAICTAVSRVSGIRHLSMSVTYPLFTFTTSGDLRTLNSVCLFMYRKKCTTICRGTYSVALQSLKDLGHLTYGRFLKLFRHMVGLLGRVISSSQGLYLHRTAQHRKTQTSMP